VRAWPVQVLFASGVVALVSVFLPWERECVVGTTAGDSFCFDRSIGLESNAGRLFALAALATAGYAAAVLAGRRVAAADMFARCAGLVAFFALAAGDDAFRFGGATPAGTSRHVAYGAIVGLAAAVVAVFAAAAQLRRSRVGEWRGRTVPIVASCLVTGLLVSLLLVWIVAPRGSGRYAGVTFSPAFVAAVLAIVVTVEWWSTSPGSAVRRLGLGVGAAVSTAGAVSEAHAIGSLSAAAWVGLAAAVGLALLGLRDARAAVEQIAVSRLALVAGLLGGAFLVALFLPWQSECFPRDGSFGAFSGHCVSQNGWSGTGAVTPALAVCTFLALALGSRSALSAAESGTALAVLVATAGYQLAEQSGGGDIRLSTGFGAYAVFVLTGALLAVSLAGFRPRRPKVTRPLAAAGLAISVCYVLVVVVPWWGVLPARLQDDVGFAPESWLTLAGALLGIHLAALWVRRGFGGHADGSALVLVPGAMLALAAIDVIARRHNERWDAGAVVGLCLLLMFVGDAERRGGLRQIRVPEILRIDRISPQ
jgi:hypothetical protein